LVGQAGITVGLAAVKATWKMKGMEEKDPEHRFGISVPELGMSVP
jgi:hypothetical protein